MPCRKHLIGLSSFQRPTTTLAGALTRHNGNRRVAEVASMTDYTDILRDKHETLRNDPRPPEELIPLALVKMESEDPTELQDALFIMQLRASHADFQAALDLCTSDNPGERALGVTILGQN